jgi:hypothetical protein
VIPPPEPDPILDGLVCLSAVDLEKLLTAAPKKRSSKKLHEADLAEEQIPRIESEMVRRGMEIPRPSEKFPEKPKKRTRKKG